MGLRACISNELQVVPTLLHGEANLSSKGLADWIGWGRGTGACFRSNFTLLICCSVEDISKKIISSEDCKSYYYENQLLLVFRVTYTYSLWALPSVNKHLVWLRFLAGVAFACLERNNSISQ